MATRFDRVTTHSRPRATEREGLDPFPVQREMARSNAAHLPPSTDGRMLPVRPLALAMTGWLALTLGLCYVAAPLGLTALGLSASPSPLLPWITAFVFAAFATLVGVLAARPTIHLGPDHRADPVLAAVLGNLLVWAIAQNLWLFPFAQMSALTLAATAGVHLLEASLLGVMFASFTRRSEWAFALGAGFRILVLGLVLPLL